MAMISMESQADDGRDLASAEARVGALVVHETLKEESARSAPLVGILLAALSFGATLFLVRSQLIEARPGSQFEGETFEAKKNAEYARRSAEFDTVFVGNSRVLNHFNTALFDDDLAKRGRPTRSFNYGLAGMRHPESMRTAEWILDQGEPHLRTLIVEVLGELTHSKAGPLHEQGAYTRRAIEWHDLARTRLVSSALSSSELSFTERMRGIYVHWHHFALRSTNLGAALGPLLVGLGLEEPAAELGPWEGFLPVHLDPNAERVAPEAVRRRVRSEVQEMRWTPQVPPPALLLESYARLVEIAERANVRLLFVIFPPHFYGDVESFSAESPHGLPALLDYRNPTRFPEFFDPRGFYNYGHYSLPAADLVTRRLAADFAAWDRATKIGNGSSDGADR
ncbi:MAG: hypothetical protein ACI9K5_004095 [Gammaproteobacteria bacterium]|jgi:hypothetical protein